MCWVLCPMASLSVCCVMNSELSTTSVNLCLTFGPYQVDVFDFHFEKENTAM